MAKKRHKKRKKLSRRQRREQGTQPAASNPAANVPEPESEPLTGDQPETEAAEPVPVTATFTPAASRGDRGIDQETAATEYPAVRRDLRKLGITIVALVLVVAGIVVWNDQSDVVGHLGNWLFSFWQ